jgi:amidase
MDSACLLREQLLAREISAVEVFEAHLEIIERRNPELNAIVTLTPDLARAQAEAADRAMARGESLGLLHGLPVAHKDLQETQGIRTTFGSPIYADYVPSFDTEIVRRMKVAGSICLGKTNTPEFGAGSQTFNPVFGKTRNPYDLTKTCGGSSGGAAVALATGMIALADGSDTGGSLRNPASF